MTVLVEDVILELVGPVMPKVSPEKLSNEMLGMLVLAHILLFPFLDLPVDLSW